MVYMPPGIRLAVKNHAAETRVSASDVFVEAVRAYLAVRGIRFDEEPAVALNAGALPPALVDPTGLGEALDRQARLIEELLLRLDEVVPRTPAGGAEPKPAGTKVAEGMKVLLDALRTAGGHGLDNEGIRAAMTAGSISTGSAESAKAVLRDAGLIRKVERRWVLAGP